LIFGGGYGQGQSAAGLAGRMAEVAAKQWGAKSFA